MELGFEVEVKAVGRADEARPSDVGFFCIQFLLLAVLWVCQLFALGGWGGGDEEMGAFVVGCLCD